MACTIKVKCYFIAWISYEFLFLQGSELKVATVPVLDSDSHLLNNQTSTDINFTQQMDASSANLIFICFKIVLTSI